MNNCLEYATHMRRFVVLLAITASLAVTAHAQSQRTDITVALPIEPTTLDACETGFQAISVVTKSNIVETLVDLDPQDASLHPRLALSWMRIDDRTVNFSLRKDVKFTDGSVFNAAAVVYNIDRGMQPIAQFRCGAAVGKAFPTFRLTARALDEYTVEVKADKPAPIMEIGFSQFPLTSPKTPFSALAREPSGTGPYKLTSWIPGREIVMQRNDDYWGAKPEVSKVTYVFRAEPSVRAAMVATDEADIGLDITEVDADNPLTDIAFFNGETTWLRLDEQYAPFKDKRVRMAVSYAINREAMIGSVISRRATVAAQLPNQSVKGFDASLKPYPYDPARARELLAAAAKEGIDTGTAIRFLGRSGVFANAEEAMQVIVSDMNAVGFNVKLEMMERVRHQRFQSRPFPDNVGPNINLIMSDNIRGDASFSIKNFYSKDAQSATYLHPELDDLIEKAAIATGEQRTGLYQAAMRKAHDEAVAVPLFYMVSFVRKSQRLQWTPNQQSNSTLQIQDIKFVTSGK